MNAAKSVVLSKPNIQEQSEAPIFLSPKASWKASLLANIAMNNRKPGPRNRSSLTIHGQRDLFPATYREPCIVWLSIMDSIHRVAFGWKIDFCPESARRLPSGTDRTFGRILHAQPGFDASLHGAWHGLTYYD